MCAQKTQLRIPADWEAHEALWIGFRSLHAIGQYDLVVLEVIKAVHQQTLVKALVEQALFLPEGKDFFQNGIDTSRIKLVYHQPAKFWLRDPGPVFAFDKENRLVALDFKYIGGNNIGITQYNPGLILLPEYWEAGGAPEQKEKDAKVAEIFQLYFPDRTIKRIDPTMLNFHGGGIHCIYQEQPKKPVRKKRKA